MSSTASNARQAASRPAPRRLQPERRYVYVIGPHEGLQKIGLATDPRTRLAALQTASPMPLVLHAAVSVPFGEAHAVEARAHRALAERRAAGEWFDVAPQQAVTVVREAAVMMVNFVSTVDTSPGPLFAYSPTRALIGKHGPASRWNRLQHACLALVRSR